MKSGEALRRKSADMGKRFMALQKKDPRWKPQAIYDMLAGEFYMEKGSLQIPNVVRKYIRKVEAPKHIEHYRTHCHCPPYHDKIAQRKENVKILSLHLKRSEAESITLLHSLEWLDSKGKG